MNSCRRPQQLNTTLRTSSSAGVSQLAYQHDPHDCISGAPTRPCAVVARGGHRRVIHYRPCPLRRRGVGALKPFEVGLDFPRRDAVVIIPPFLPLQLGVGLEQVLAHYRLAE